MPYSFTSVEGVFWVALGFVVVFFILHGVPIAYQFLATSNALTLFVFGFTDFLQNLFFQNNHLAEMWLFVLRAACMLLLCASVVWFYRMQRRELQAAKVPHKV